MKNFDITLYCCFCSEKITRVIGREGWWIYANCIDEEAALCPHHAIISSWIDSCCSGCVGGWHDCDLWKSFAYRKRTITAEQLKIIEEGICPFRTNGIFATNKGKIDDSDVSERAPKDASEALAFAIKEYTLRYANDET
jgi:hypothetical protein